MILFFIVFLAVASIFFSTIYYGIGPVPTSFVVARRLISFLPRDKKKVVFELGSGWGNLIFPIAKEKKLWQVYSFEISFVPFFFSFLVSKIRRYKNIIIYRRNFFSCSLQKADIVICYLYPKAMVRLEKKLKAELKQGSIVISHTFSFPSWKPTKIEEAKDIYRTKIYFYEINEKNNF
jgi:predicted RNA methylase